MENSLEQGLSFEGAVARVQLGQDRVTLTPKGGSSTEISDMRRKMNLLDKLRMVTGSVEGLIVPRILSRDENTGKYEVERAVGLNLSDAKWDRQGDVIDFLKISAEMKMRAVVIYLNMVGILNNTGLAIRDHKSDSIFIDPNDGTITVVDADALVETPKPWLIDRSFKNGMPDVLKAMFTRGLKRDALGIEESLLIPAGLCRIVEGLSDTENASEAVERINLWKRGELGKKFPGYELASRRKEIDKPGMSDYQYDIAEVEFYSKEAMSSEEFGYHLKHR